MSDGTPTNAPRRRLPLAARWVLAGAAAAIAIGAVIAIAVVLVNPSDGPSVPPPVAATQDSATRQDNEIAALCAEPTQTVSTATELQKALDAAGPGSVIRLADGVYEGSFRAAVDGTPDSPVALCGAPSSVLDGGGIEEDYVFHLDQASNWILHGFTVRNGQKGVMADATSGTTIDGLTVTSVGDEGIHLRSNSTHNTVSANRISDTGLRKPKFGEGIYIGSAESNWCDISQCEPDRSDRNTVVGNTISATTAESIDVKEGTTGGVIRGNTFDGSAIVGADSWVDVKGNDWLIEENSGVDSPMDGFQTHEIIDGWGTDNVFRENKAIVNGPGYGYALTPVRGNVVECSNSTSAAGDGSSNTKCTTD